MAIKLKFTVGDIHVFTFTTDSEGGLDVRAKDKASLLAALDKVEEMVEFVRSKLECEVIQE